MNYKHDCDCIANYTPHTPIGRCMYYFPFFFTLSMSFHVLFSHRRKVFKVTVGISTCCYNGCSSLLFVVDFNVFYLRSPFSYFGCSKKTDYVSLIFFFSFHSFFMHHNCDFLPFSMHSLCTLFLQTLPFHLASLTFCVWCLFCCLLPLPWLELWISCSKYM